MAVKSARAVMDEDAREDPSRPAATLPCEEGVRGEGRWTLELDMACLPRYRRDGLRILGDACDDARCAVDLDQVARAEPGGEARDGDDRRDAQFARDDGRMRENAASLDHDPSRAREEQ